MSTPRNARKGAKDAMAADSGTHGGSDAREALSEPLSVHHVEWGVKRPEPYEGIITDYMPRAAAERLSRSIQADRGGAWPVVTRTLYVTEWVEADGE